MCSCKSPDDPLNPLCLVTVFPDMPIPETCGQGPALQCLYAETPVYYTSSGPRLFKFWARSAPHPDPTSSSPLCSNIRCPLCATWQALFQPLGLETMGLCNADTAKPRLNFRPAPERFTPGLRSLDYVLLFGRNANPHDFDPYVLVYKTGFHNARLPEVRFNSRQGECIVLFVFNVEH